MSTLCAIAALVLELAVCKPPPTPYDADYVPAYRHREALAAAIDTSNRILHRSDMPYRLTPSWRNDVFDSTEERVGVYLVKSHAPPSTVERSYERVRTMVQRIVDAPLVLDEERASCTDADDCVRDLYGRPASELALDTLREMFDTELASAIPVCRCIVVREDDLERFAIRFTMNWDVFLLTLMYDSAEQVQRAADTDKIPDVIADGEPTQLESFLPLFLLHELGHFADPGGVSTAYVDDLGEELGETLRSTLAGRLQPELSADHYAATLFRDACTGSAGESAIADACLASGLLSILLYALTFPGKSDAALCWRYLDQSASHPNLHLRYLLKDYHSNPDSASARNLLQDFLDIRMTLETRGGNGRGPRCGLRPAVVPPAGRG